MLFILSFFYIFYLGQIWITGVLFVLFFYIEYLNI